MSSIFFGPAALIAYWPYAGVAIAVFLFATQMLLTAKAGKAFDKTFFREAAVFAGFLWLIFGFYEMQMLAAMDRASASEGSKNFLRIDLVILVPILYLMSAAAIYSIVRQLRNKK